MKLEEEDHKMVPSSSDQENFHTNNNLIDKEEPDFSKKDKEAIGLEISLEPTPKRPESNMSNPFTKLPDVQRTSVETLNEGTHD